MRRGVVARLAAVTLAVVACRPMSAESTPPTPAPTHPLSSVSTTGASPAPTSRAASGSPATTGLTAVVADDAAVFQTDATVTLELPVSAGGGFAILGRSESSGHVPTAYAWLSPDGRVWERVAVPELDKVNVERLVELPDGRLLVSGQTIDGARLWVSDDRGRTWTGQPALPGAATASTFLRIAAGPAGILIAGTRRVSGRQAAALWSSPDARAWEEVRLPDDVFGDVEINDVAATATGFVAVGGRASTTPAAPGDPTRGHRAAAWRSPDGRVWTAATVTDGPSIFSIYAAAGGIVGIGFGDGATISEGQGWHSADGTAWTKVPKLDTANARPIIHDGRFYVLRERFAAGAAVTQLDVTTDGLAWETIASGPIDRGSSSVGVVAGGEPGIIQVGYRDGKALVWFMPWPAT